MSPQHTPPQAARPTVVFIHGLWLLAESWNPWRALFEDAGYPTIAPGWPSEAASLDEARARPELLAGAGIASVVDHFARVIETLAEPPAIIGHSFGGLIAQILAGRGLAAVSVPIDPAPGRGVLRLPPSALRAAAPALRNPANRRRTVMLTFEQFRFAFANAVEQPEAQALYDQFAVPGPGRPLFEAAAANLNPHTPAQANAQHPRRGPMKFIAGGRDHTVPAAVTRAAFNRQRHNPAVTEIENFPDRGHSLVFDSGWQAVAESTLNFVEGHRPH
jgi:pimeloyl-ACP methyl ester carboxylesterase